MAAPTPDHAGPSHGFALDQVGWAHRDLFERAIGDLMARGLIGPERREVTATFFGLLRQADRGSWDHVLRRFLGALTPRNEWLLEIPALFAEVVGLGRDLAARRPHRGGRFFAILAERGLGETPAEVRLALDQARRLRDLDDDLALAFLEGSADLSRRLQPGAIEAFVDAGMAAFKRQPQAGRAFLEGRLESAAALIAALSRECRLQDRRGALAALLQALAGSRLELAPLTALGGVLLEDRGTGSVCLDGVLYLPESVCRSEHRHENRAWYTLAVVCAAAAWRLGAFCRLGEPRRGPRLCDLAGPGTLRLNALILAEASRLITGVRRLWPGARGMLRAGLAGERQTTGGAARLGVLWQALADDPGGRPDGLRRLLTATADAATVFETAARLDDGLIEAFRRDCPALADEVLPAVSFLPDDLAIAPETGARPDARRSVMTAAPTRPDAVGTGTTAPVEAGRPDDLLKEAAEADDATTPPTAFVYDEWSQEDQDYRRGHCLVFESISEPLEAASAPPPELAVEARRVRAAFERLRPEALHRERFLCDGDAIDHDRLLRALVERRVDPSPRFDIYEKPRVNRRDLAVVLLLDLSGSTGETTAAGPRRLDLERQAAAVLAEGLDALGDRLIMAGFRSRGPRDCAFVVFKEIDEPWSPLVWKRLQAVQPGDSTRIGPALRHAGWRLGHVACRQRLILLITDGKPMDVGYEPATHQAHHDVRKACEENARLGIRTFAISTEANSAADLEIMVSTQRFVILPDLRDLPRLLPKLYGRLTL
ncbi:MAG: hypothetical protein GX595_03395 [Lentisphaerae bacterium]|nr:hypothetical protein [Lentisphaerota bacterium]